MDFLKEILGEELYKQLESKVNEHNGNEANKDKQIKIGNLGTGDYVGKGKYEALQELMNGKETELKSANDLIAELKKGTKGNEELQGKIAGYETQVADLQKELAETKVKSALKVALLSEKCDDVDYVTYVIEKQLKEKGKVLELDGNENIKDWDNLISGLKTQLSSHFESGNRNKQIEENRLPENNNGGSSMTKNEFLKKPYSERVAFKNDNPSQYEEIMKG